MPQSSSTKTLWNPFPSLRAGVNNPFLTHTLAVLELVAGLAAQLLQAAEGAHGVDTVLSPLAGVPLCHTLVDVCQTQGHISATACRGISLFLLLWKEQKAQVEGRQCSYRALMGDGFSPGSLVSTQ